MSDTGRSWVGYSSTDGFRVLDKSSKHDGRNDHSHTSPDPTFVADMWQVFDELGNLLLDKHMDYGPTNISRSPGSPLNGLRVRIHDKVARINHLIDTGAEPTNESLRDSFKDLANYAAIALMVLDGNWPEK